MGCSASSCPGRGSGCLRRVVRLFQFRVLDRMRSAEDHQQATAGVLGPVPRAPMDRFAVVDQRVARIECCAQDLGAIVAATVTCVLSIATEWRWNKTDILQSSKKCAIKL